MFKDPQYSRQVMKACDLILLYLSKQGSSSVKKFVSSDGFYPHCVKIKEEKEEDEFQDLLFQVLVVPHKYLTHIYKKEPLLVEPEEGQDLLDFKQIKENQNPDQDIEFGASLVIVHVKSNKFLSVVEETEEIDLYSITLQYELTSKGLFKIIPCYKSQVQTSQTVNYDSDIKIASIHLEKEIDSIQQDGESNQKMLNYKNLQKMIYINLNASNDAQVPEDDKETNKNTIQNQLQQSVITEEEDEEQIPMPMVEENVKGQQECPQRPSQSLFEKQQQKVIKELSNLGNFQGDLSLLVETGTSFRIQLYQHQSEVLKQNLIQFGDVVRIQHLQTNSHLEVFNEKEKGLSQQYNPSYVNMEKEYEYLTQRGTNIVLFQIKSDRQTEMMHMAEKGFNVFRMKQASWRLEQVDFRQHLHGNGNAISTGDIFYIQNMHTLEYLKLNQIDQPSNKRGKIIKPTLGSSFGLERSPSEQCEFHILRENESLSTKSQGIQKDCIFYLIHKTTGYYLGIENKMLEVEDLKDDKQIFDPNITFRKPVLNQTLNQGDCYKFKFLSNEEQLLQTYIIQSKIALNHLDSSQKILKFGVLFFRLQSKKIIQKLQFQKGQHIDHSDPNTEDITERLLTAFFLEIYTQVKTCIEDLIRYCLDIPSKVEINKQTLLLNKPDLHHQRILREREMICVIQLLLENLLASQQVVLWVRSFNDEDKQTLDIPLKKQIHNPRKSSIFIQRQSIVQQSIQVQSKEQTEFLTQELKELGVLYKELVKVIYSFVEAFGKSNHENSIIVLIFYYYFEKHLGFGLGSGNCLLQVLQSNQSLIQIINQAAFKMSKQMTFQSGPGSGSFLDTEKNVQFFQKKISRNHQLHQESINKDHKTLIDLLFQRFKELQSQLGLYYWTCFIKILKTLCVNQGVVYNQNQATIGIRLFADSNRNALREYLIPLFSNNTQQLVIGVRKGTFQNLKSQTLSDSLDPQFQYFELLELYKLFKGKTKRIDAQKAKHEIVISYINNQLDLLCDVCQGRNYFNITKIRDIIKTNELAKYIKNESIQNDNLRAKLVTLALNVYIDAEPYILVEYPKFIRKTISQISYEKANIRFDLKFEEVADGTKHSEIELAELDLSNTKYLIESVYEKAVFDHEEGNRKIYGDNDLIFHDSEDGQQIKSDSTSSLFMINRLSSLNTQQIETIKSFVQSCLFEKILTKTGESHRTVKIQLNHFNSKIFQLFQKMYGFKLISGKGFDNRKLLYTYMQKLLEVQEYLPTSFQRQVQRSSEYVEIHEQNDQLSCYIMITEYLYDIYKHFVLQEEHYHSQQVIDFLCSKVNKPKVKVSDLVKEMKEYLPKLRLIDQTRFDDDSIFHQASLTKIADLAQLQDQYVLKFIKQLLQSKLNIFQMTINHLLQESNDFGCDQKIFDFFYYYMQPRRNIIKNLKKYQIILTPEEKTVQKYLKKVSKQLHSISENAENLNFKESLSEEENESLLNVIDLLADIQTLMYQKSKIDSMTLKPSRIVDGTSIISHSRQNILRHLHIHDFVLELIDNLTLTIKRIDTMIQEKFALKDSIELQTSQRLIIKLLNLAFSILSKFIANQNSKNKKLIFQRCHIFTPYLKLINVNQYAMLAELFHNEPELCLYVHFSTLQELVSNSCFFSLQILENLIQAGGYIINANVAKIIKLIFNKKNFYKFLGMTVLDLQNQIGNRRGSYYPQHHHMNKQVNLVADFDLEVTTLLPFEFVELTGKVPYLYHIRVLCFVRKLFSLTKGQKQFYNLFSQFISPQMLFKLISDMDMFKPQWGLQEGPALRQQACLIILKTHLKIQILNVLKEIVLSTDKVLNSIGVISSLQEFFEFEEGRIIQIEEDSEDFLIQVKELEMQAQGLNLYHLERESPLLRNWIEKIVQSVILLKSQGGDCDQQKFQSEGEDSDKSLSVKSKKSVQSGGENKYNCYFELICWFYSEVQQKELLRNEFIQAGNQAEEDADISYLSYELNFNQFYIQHIFGFTSVVIKRLQEQLVKVEIQEDNSNLSNLSTRTFSISLLGNKGFIKPKSNSIDEIKRQSSSVESQNQTKVDETAAKKLKLMQNLLDKITSFSLTFEGYISEYLTVSEYAGNKQRIQNSMSEFLLIFNRNIQFAFQKDPLCVQQLKDLEYIKEKPHQFLNYYTQPNFVIDSRLQDIIHIQEEQSSDPKLHKLSYFILATQTSSYIRNEFLLEERIHYLNMIRQHPKFELLITKLFSLLNQGVENILEGETMGLAKLQQNAATVLQCIGVLQHLIEIEGIDLSQGVKKAQEDYKNIMEKATTSDQNRGSESQENFNWRIKFGRLKKKKLELQCLIADLGVFQLFFNFVGQAGQDMIENVNDFQSNQQEQDEDYNEEGEQANKLIFYRKKIGGKVFRGLLLLCTKLLRVDEIGNIQNQDKFFQEISRQKSNIFIKRIYFMLCREITEFQKKQNDMKMTLKEDLRRICFSYKFNEENILSKKPCHSLGSLAYQLSKKQTKFVLKNFHKEIFKKIKQIPKNLRYQQVQSQSEEYFTDFLLQEETIFYIIRFIILLGEDHHQQLQNYLRDQEQPQNYDIIQKLTDLLKVYLFESFGFGIRNLTIKDQVNLSYQTQLKILSCFDAIIELVQGPCTKNQQRVCQPGFLQMVSNVLQIDDSHFQFLESYGEIIGQYFKDKKSFAQQIAKQLNIKNSGRSDSIDKKQSDELRTRNMTFNTQNQFLARNQFRGAWTQAQTRILMHYGNTFPIYAKQMCQSFQVSNPSNQKIAMISQLKQKCVTTLQSLIDGEQISLLKEISLYIPEQIITNNLTIIYEKYKIIYKTGKNYKNEVFEHLTTASPIFDIEYDIEKCVQLHLRSFEPYTGKSYRESLRQINKKFFKVGAVQEIRSPESALQDLWKSTIIETGFSLFNLLTSYYYIKQNDGLQRIYDQIEKKRLIKQQLYRNKFILFQILYFVKDLFTTSRIMMESFTFTHDLERAFVMYKMEKNLKEDSKTQNLKLGYRALRFFAKRTGSIEVQLNSQLQRVIFPLMPHCFSLNNTLRREFSNKIDRFSSQTKVESVLIGSNEIIEKLKYEYNFYHFYMKQPIINLFASNISLWKQLSFIFIILENIAVLQDNRPVYFKLDTSTENNTLFIFNLCQLLMISITFSFFLIKKAPYLLQKASERIREKRIERIRVREIKYNYLESTAALQAVDDEFFFQQEKKQNLKWYKVYGNWTSDQLLKFSYVLSDPEMIYFIVFTSFALLGFFNRFFVAGLLVDVFWRFPTLAYVINSIWRPKEQIILILGLFLIAQYYQSLIMFYFFYNSYQPECETLSGCFAFIQDVTFKVDGGFVGYYLSMGQPNYQEDYSISVQSVQEFCYVFLVINLVYAIITGTIIDTFGVLREEAEATQQDIQGTCLICGIDRGTIDKKSKHKKGFSYHVKYEHNSWNYIFFISYLLDKNQSEYFGLESYIFERIQNQEITWFPLNKSLSIPGDGEQTEEIQSMKEAFNSRFQTIEEKLNTILSRVLPLNQEQ